jgi:SAM-dependent methyltransferase
LSGDTPHEKLSTMSELWRTSAQRSQEFDAAAAAYDLYRPRYPIELFEDIIGLGELKPGARAIEVGAGTGIATGPLISRGLRVVAIEPAPAMLSIASQKFGSNARFVEGRFEDWPPTETVELIAAFNAWHSVEPDKGVRLAAELLSAGGSLALVWTDVLSWGDDDFDTRLAEVTGAPWPKGLEHVLDSLQPVRASSYFDDFRVSHHRFERKLDADSFIAVTRTYGGYHTSERDQLVRHLIDDEFGGEVTKVEDAVLYVAGRRRGHRTREDPLTG